MYNVTLWSVPVTIISVEKAISMTILSVPL